MGLLLIHSLIFASYFFHLHYFWVTLYQNGASSKEMADQ